MKSLNCQILDSQNSLWLQTLQDCRHDVYHQPEYVDLEASMSHSIAEAVLIQQDEKIFFLPYLLRQINAELTANAEDLFDVVSPYGYPGIVCNSAALSSSAFIEAAVGQLISTFRDRNVCAAFVRLHPILNASLDKILSPEICHQTGETVAINLTVSSAELWHQTRDDHRRNINRAKREGLTARIVPLSSHVQVFNSVYQEVMQRVGATQSYYFGEDYFAQLAKLDSLIHLCLVEFEQQVLAAGLYTECCNIVQSHLSGTRTEFLKQTPDKFMIDYVRSWAKGRGNQVMHLGGGFGGRRDRLFEFKAGFSKQRCRFLTLRLVIDNEKYNKLVNARAKQLEIQPETLLQSSYFPAYRASI